MRQPPAPKNQRMQEGNASTGVCLSTVGTPGPFQVPSEYVPWSLCLEEYLRFLSGQNHELIHYTGDSKPLVVMQKDFHVYLCMYLCII